MCRLSPRDDARAHPLHFREDVVDHVERRRLDELRRVVAAGRGRVSLSAGDPALTRRGGGGEPARRRTSAPESRRSRKNFGKVMYTEFGREPCIAYATKAALSLASSSAGGSTTSGGVRRFLKPPGPAAVVATVAEPLPAEPPKAEGARGAAGPPWWERAPRLLAKLDERWRPLNSAASWRGEAKERVDGFADGGGGCDEAGEVSSDGITGPTCASGTRQDQS